MNHHRIASIMFVWITLRCSTAFTPATTRAYTKLTTLLASSNGRISNAVQDKSLLDKTNTDETRRVVSEKLDTNPPKGTRDFYPEDMRLRNWLFDQWRDTARISGFVEYDAPVLESEALYTRKAGEEVTQQLYNFVDKGERAVTLRPEMTPSLARMVMAKKGALPLPFKWFSIPQCWRYERMTRGRRREHFQWNMDIWGVAGEEAEAELIAAMVRFFEGVGLTSEDVGIKVNSRLVIGEVLNELGIPPEKFAATCVLVDKLEKVPVDAIQGELEELGLDRSVVEKLLNVLTNKSIESLRETLGADSKAVLQLEKFMSLCDAYGIQDWIILDASVVRGLAYYTGIVFEAFDRKGQLRAIAGGGRYDKLLETFGGDSIPAAGFGFGDAVIVELLKERNILPSFEESGIDTVVFAMNEKLFPVAIQAATALRKAGQSVDLILEAKKSKWVFKHADRLGAKYCLIVGESEYENGEVAVKDLKLGQQANVKIEELVSWATSQ
ncbi:histidyl-tRNA synthetase [Fistulifera solaris]|jgi:histidyl-tRNA synthetase|uniref:histidine--tRNA ligase n=1 Tax=Fistulifera solaris TaxID=1519565 RepID=A0A1Z5JJR6_FISSO|nr:histidyl-tRNA synthetase [Fistulifera solaris]|eukprot:GAX14260.1 histidyl-tRNA synthetase [Fistulifera solaris]